MIGKDKYMVMQTPERLLAIRATRMFSSKIGRLLQCGAVNCRGVYSVSFFKLNKKPQKKHLTYLDTWFKKLYRKELEKLAKS